MKDRDFSIRVMTWLIAKRWLMLAAASILACLAVVPAQRLEFDRSIENMFALNDPLLAPYQKMQRTFGGNEIVLAAYVDADLMTPAGMQRLQRFSDQIREVPGLGDVLSLRSPMGDKIIDRSNPLATRFRALFSGYTHAVRGDQVTVAVVGMLEPESQTQVTRAETIRRLRGIVQDYPSGTIAGEPVMVVDGFRYIQEDGRLLGRTSTILLGFTILVCFRSLRWLLVPLAVVQWALLMTRAVLVWTQFRLSMVSSMLTAIVTVVGVATVVHVVIRFRAARIGGRTPVEALLAAGGSLVIPVFWACTTDAVGFAALRTAGVGPVQDFGTMMALGSLMVIVSVALILPCLTVWGGIDVDPQRAWGEDRLDNGLRTLLSWVEARPKTLLALVAFLVSVCAVGSIRLEVETDFTKNFRSASPIVRSYRFVEENLGGAGVWDVVLPAPQRLDWPYLSRVLRLERRLRREIPELTKVLSLADMIEAGAPQGMANIRPTSVRRSIVGTGVALMRARMPGFTQALYNQDPESKGNYYFRIMLRAREQQPSTQKRAMIEKVRAICTDEFLGVGKSLHAERASGNDAEVTGYFVLLTNLIDSMVRDQWITFAVASAGIGIMMLVAFRSLQLAAVALVPNVLPVFVLTGVMGWSGLKINMGAAMIAAVSVGLSVDSSIHYVTAYGRARLDGMPYRHALDAVHQSVGRAMVFSTLALIVGFSVLCLSQFVPTVYFGALVSLSMLGGLAGNLVVLPLLLQLIEGPSE